MQKEGGVYKIPCVVNGLRLKFIFDTGASNVSISLSEANLMLGNGYLDKKDIIGKGTAQIADGSIVNNTKIILREIKIDGLILKDVEAVVINELKAPLLLGQSAIEKLGKIQIEGDEMIVLNAKGNNYTQAEIDEMFKQAEIYTKDNMYAAAADTYQTLYDLKQLTDYGIEQLAQSYYMSNNDLKALQYFLEIKNKSIGETKESIDYYKWYIYTQISRCYCTIKDYAQAELYIQKSMQFMANDFSKMGFLQYFS
jgi:clan AA aspartic protease (TIGR02281 family)